MAATPSVGYATPPIVAKEPGLLDALLVVFGKASDDSATYGARRPGPDLCRAASRGPETFVALVAMKDDALVGGLTAYELVKFEQQRSAICNRDFAVSAEHRRHGIATGSAAHLRTIARECGAYVVFVQADPVVGPAAAIQSRMGPREDVLHFDIAVR